MTPICRTGAPTETKLPARQLSPSLLNLVLHPTSCSSSERLFLHARAAHVWVECLPYGERGLVLFRNNPDSPIVHWRHEEATCGLDLSLGVRLGIPHPQHSGSLSIYARGNAALFISRPLTPVLGTLETPRFESTIHNSPPRRSPRQGRPCLNLYCAGFSLLRGAIEGVLSFGDLIDLLRVGQSLRQSQTVRPSIGKSKIVTVVVSVRRAVLRGQVVENTQIIGPLMAT